MIPIYLLALLSGAAALIYEVTWAKMLALTFGSTTSAQAAVVVGFLGGAGLGAALYHRWGRRSHAPLFDYALLELGIAASTAALAQGFYALPEGFARLSAAIDSPLAYASLRYAASAGLIALPSLLMGATFPALCRAAIDSASGVDRRLGWIYGVNTLGAALGALLAGLILIERLGLRATSLAANAINLLVALGALVLLVRSRRSPALSGSERAPEVIPTELPSAVTAVVLFVSGLCTLAYEILWFRGLRYLVGSSTYAFAIVLFAFLSGLGLGALLLGRIARRRTPERDLSLIQAGVALSALGAIATLAACASVPALFQRLSIFVPAVRDTPWWSRLLVDAGFALVLLLPATLCMGLSFPLATRLYLGDVARLERRVGRAYLLANLGSIAGSVGGALLLLPALGVVRGTGLVAGINLLLCAWIAARAPGPGPAGWSALGLGVAALFGYALGMPPNLRLVGDDVLEGARMEQVFLEEGDLSSVQVLRDPAQPARLSMSIDGSKIGWSAGFGGSPNYLKQVLLADLPLLLDERIRTTLSIGLGSAATLSALSDYPWIERLDCVEINAAVVTGAQLFPESAVISDARVRVFVDDAVHFLLRTPEHYDLIVSDGKQDPFYSGNANLLCREFYAQAAARMSAQGLLVQWFPLGTLESDLRTVIATLCDAFPCVDAFCYPPASLFLVAGTEPLSARPRTDSAALARLPLEARLAPHGLERPATLLAHWVAGRDPLARLCAQSPRSSWDRLILDHSPFKAPARAWREAEGANLQLLEEASSEAGALAGPALSDAERPRLETARALRQSYLAMLRGRVPRAIALARRALELSPDDPQARVVLENLRELARGTRPGPGPAGEN